MSQPRRNIRNGGTEVLTAEVRTRRDAQSDTVGMGMPQDTLPCNPPNATTPATTSTERNLPDHRSGTSEVQPRRRIKWTQQMNKDIMELYFHVTNCERIKTGYRTKLHEQFTRKYPHLTLTEQNVADRKSAIIRNKLLPSLTIEEIRARIETELQTTNEERRNTNENTITPPQTSASNTNAPEERLRSQTQENTVDTADDTNEHESQRIHESEINEANHEVNGDTNEEREKLEKLKKELETARIEWEGIPIDNRPNIPKQNNSTKLIILTEMANKNLIPEILPTIDSIADLQNHIYLTAFAIARCNGANIKTGNNQNKKQNIPAWERRIKQETEELRSELARLIEYKRGTNSRRLKAKINKIMRKHKQHTRRDIPNQTIEQVMDTIKQRISVLAKRMRKYKKSNARKADNSLFINNQKTFYAKSKGTENIEIINPPNMQEVEEYWRNIWSHPVHHNKEANLMEIIENNTRHINQMTSNQITMNTLQTQIAKMHNWKCPGPDKIHNFWLKKLTNLHPKILELINRAIENPDLITSKLCEGTTYLKPKSHETQNPAQYRPITCLNTIYKLITGCLTHDITQHCEEENILADEQKGSRAKTLGCKEQLTIDSIVMNQAVKKKRNLYTCFIDYVKAYDKIPHSWIIHTLQLYKINTKYINFLQNIMKKWQTTITLKVNTETMKTAKVQIKRGIYQGDSLSSLLFCICMNPLSTLLKHNDKGFQIKTRENNHTLTHLFYIDDLKLYGNSEENLLNSIELVEKYSKEIKMELGTNKCKIQAIQKGKLTTEVEYTTANLEKIDAIEPTEYYKYLGVEQCQTIDHTKAKGKIKNLFNSRLKTLMKSSLNSKNLTKAVNTFAIPILTYSFGIINWSKTELEALERNLRTTLTKFNKHHPKSACERITIPRNQGGRGFIDITHMHNKQIQNIKEYFWNKQTESDLIRVATQADQNYTPLNLSEQPSTITNIPINQLQRKINEWKTKSLHGRYPNELDHPHVDVEQSCKWLTEGKLFPETEGFFISIQDQVVATKNHRKHIIKEPNLQDDKCRWCGQQSETIQHLMAGCQVLSQNDYTKRHDNMGKILHQALEIKLISSNKDTPYWKYEPQPVIETNDHVIYWNRTIYTDRTVGHNRPDSVVICKKERTAHLIDYAVVNNNNVLTTYNEKIRRYQDLKEEIKEQWNIQTVKIHPIIMSTSGIVPKTMAKHLQELNIHKSIIAKMQHSVILSICNLIRKTLN